MGGPEKDGNTPPEGIIPDAEEEEEEWEAVEWIDIEPPSDDSVFPAGRVDSILREMLKKAWEDGAISDDEMALLSTLKDNLGIDDGSFKTLLDETRPSSDVIPSKKRVEVLEEGIDDDLWGDDDTECAPAEAVLDDVVTPREAPAPPGAPLLADPIPEKENVPLVPSSAVQGSPIITLTSTIREGVRPLTTSFDLVPKAGPQRKRCVSCRSLVRFDSGSGKDRCPVCGSSLQEGDEGSDQVRGQLDQAKNALKSGNLRHARSLLNEVMTRYPNNKEALFYHQRVTYALSTKGLGGTRPTTLDSRELVSFSTGVPRLDQLIRGGFPVGAQVLFKGPAFSGKEVLMDHVSSSALRSGFPIIYVSSTKAMKDVLRGILRRVPDFKRFNQEGRVRLYDLFTKEVDQKVMMDGHRLFHIDTASDFQKFTDDLLFVQEELTKEFGGGVLIINSLSPLILKAQANAHQKFIQTLIARSKGYRFTNIFDLASGIHDEPLINSLEYMMDGIIDFREQDARYSLRVRGLSQSVITRDWIEYNFSECGMDLFGSFTEERIA